MPMVQGLPSLRAKSTLVTSFPNGVSVLHTDLRARYWEPRENASGAPASLMLVSNDAIPDCDTYDFLPKDASLARRSSVVSRWSAVRFVPDDSKATLKAEEASPKARIDLKAILKARIYKCELKHLQHEASDVESYTYIYIYIYIHIYTRMTCLLESWRHLSFESMRHLSS
jgi:hypothetical protein